MKIEIGSRQRRNSVPTHRRPSYQGEVSSVLDITASIVQGSAIGPASYVVNTSDLRAVTPGNELLKFADDTYIIIPAVNASIRQAELDHIHEWAQTNNLKANLNKYVEIVFVDNKRRRKLEIQPIHHSQISIEDRKSVV